MRRRRREGERERSKEREREMGGMWGGGDGGWMDGGREGGGGEGGEREGGPIIKRGDMTGMSAFTQYSMAGVIAFIQACNRRTEQ